MKKIFLKGKIVVYYHNIIALGVFYKRGVVQEKRLIEVT
jgi:hypothetical protein